MVKTSTRIVGALALAAAIASSGPVLAAKPGKGGGGPGMLGDLSAARDSVIVKVPIDCDLAGVNQTKSESLSVKIFQSVGRLLNIGTFSVASSPLQPLCTGSATEIEVTVKAIPGLTFQPGPATILIKLTDTTTTTTPNVNPLLPAEVKVDVVETETGARIDLH
jgi:hypothetical protein